MRRTILVVEDEPAIMRLVSEILDMQDYEVLYASTAVEGLRVARRLGPIHLLLINAMLEGGRLGTDVAAAIKLSRPKMRVILLAGKVGNHLSVLADGWKVLQTPSIAADLLARVRAELTGGLSAAGR